MEWIGPVLVALIVPLALGGLTKAAAVPAKTREGKSWLEYGSIFKIFSLIILLIPCVLAFIYWNADAESKFPLLMMILLFGGLGLPLFLEAFFVKIGFDDSTLLCYSPWRSNRRISLSDLQKPYFSDGMQWWVIPTNNDGNIYLHSFISGASELLEKTENQGQKGE